MFDHVTCDGSYQNFYKSYCVTKRRDCSVNEFTLSSDVIGTGAAVKNKNTLSV